MSLGSRLFLNGKVRFLRISDVRYERSEGQLPAHLFRCLDCADQGAVPLSAPRPSLLLRVAPV